MDFRDQLAIQQFDKMYDQLGTTEKEWVKDSIDYFFS